MAKQDTNRTPRPDESIDDELIRGSEETDDAG